MIDVRLITDVSAKLEFSTEDSISGDNCTRLSRRKMPQAKLAWSSQGHPLALIAVILKP